MVPLLELIVSLMTGGVSGLSLYAQILSMAIQ